MRLAVLLTLGALALLSPLLSAAASPPQLPDLGVSPIRHSLMERTQDGTKRLRFSVSIANVGKGVMEVVAARPSRGATPWTSWQRIRRVDGSTFRVPLPHVRMTFVGDPDHGHWHIYGAARYELRPLGKTNAVRIHVKRGFCLYDSTPYKLRLPGAPREREYQRDGCGAKRDRALAMGVSVGWQDDYYWRISGQAFDITGLPTGKYRLLATVDPRNWFRESNERNNVTWVDLQIGKDSVKELRNSKRV